MEDHPVDQNQNPPSPPPSSSPSAPSRHTLAVRVATAASDYLLSHRRIQENPSMVSPERMTRLWKELSDAVAEWDALS